MGLNFFALKSLLGISHRSSREVEGNGFVIRAHKQITLWLLNELWLISYEEMLEATV